MVNRIRGRAAWISMPTAVRARRSRNVLTGWALVILAFIPAHGAIRLTADDYRRAEKMLPASATTLVEGLELKPQWTGKRGDFRYATRRNGAPAFFHVDSSTGVQTAISEDEIAAPPDLGDNAPIAATTSPDGQWTVLVIAHDLYVRGPDADQPRRLTHDGAAGHAYASRAGLQVPPATDDASPVVYFSPDSRRILTYRLDYSDVPELHLVATRNDKRPQLLSFPYPMPGDPVARAELIILDLTNGHRVNIDHPPVPIRPPSDLQVRWSNDGRSAFFLEEEAGFARAWVRAIDTATGTVHTVLEERADTVLARRPVLEVIGDGSELLWSSERSGWRHLYLLDAASGGIKRQLTDGAWNVHRVSHIDVAGGWVYFVGLGREDGRDPYYRHLYRVRLDGTDTTLLTPEDADHQITFSPDGSVFVDTYSRVDQAPVSVLRRSDGRKVAELQRADIQPLLDTGWRFPERFTVKARDGRTDLFGVLYLPSHFDPARRYPVIDSIYPGPQRTHAPKSFTLSAAQSLAELGFVVMEIDGMGTPNRSRAFREVSYRNLGDAGGLADHVAALRQLARERPWMDLDRVGIFGHSGGGFASTRAILTYPEVFKVAVSSAGNHDQRIYHAGWGERFHDYPHGDNYDGLDNASLAHRLQGKLLLVHGDADDNVHPAHTLALAQALIEADKDFDLLILPGQSHAFKGRANDYFIRRRWDYFVRHLLGSEPPTGYRVDTIAEPDSGVD